MKVTTLQMPNISNGNLNPVNEKTCLFTKVSIAPGFQIFDFDEEKLLETLELFMKRLDDIFVA